MKYTFSERIQEVKPSAIREILKVIATTPGIISFATGSPSAESIPVDEIKAISESIYEKMPILSLQYNVTEGYQPLRNRTKDRLKNRFNIGTPSDDVIITTGGQQGLELTAKILCNQNDVVIVESLSFVSGINAFKSNGAHVIGIPMDDEGIELEALEASFRQNENVKLLYLIPTFQNPSGKTMSLQRRKDVYDLCVRYGVLILEDNPYGELRFTGEDIPTLKSMDTEGIVIYDGSYSKIISAGMRIGFVCANKNIIEKLVVAKQVGDCHSNIFFQIVVDQLFDSIDMDAHIRRISKIYSDKCALMLRLIEDHFDHRIAFTKPEGGLFIWCTLPEGYDATKLAQFAVNRGVAFVPGCSFMVNDSAPCPSFRLNYSTPSTEDIQKGIPLLAQIIDDFLKSEVNSETDH